MSAPTQLPLISLHSHTVYSLLDAASNIDDYIKWAIDHGAPAVGVTDHGYMIGLLELVTKCKKSGLTPLPGCELYVAPDAGYEFAGRKYQYYHITAWAVNEVGYRNLLKLGSLSFTESFSNGEKRVVSRFYQNKPRITFDELLHYNEGIVLASGCLIGALNKAWLSGEWAGALYNLNRLLEVYKDRFFIEILPHNCTHDFDRKQKKFVQNECTAFAPDGDIQKACNLKAIETARRFNIPLLMTVDSHFVYPHEKAKQDLLLQNGDPSGWKFWASYHMLTTHDAWAHWQANYGGDVENKKIFTEAVENNHLIASLAKGFDVKDRYHQPEILLPDDIKHSAATESEALKLLILRRIDEHKRMRWDDPVYVGRLQKELSVICDNGIINFSQYFLWLEEQQRWTREHSILSAPGRGSGAGSLVCYLLKITHLDPIKYKLPFERFLSMGRLTRGKTPDIDSDFSDRELLIAKLMDEYGDKIAQCSTHGSLKIRSAIKDACRAILGWNAQDPRVERVTKSVDMTPVGVSDRDFLLGYTDSDGQEHQGHLSENKILEVFFNEHQDVYKMALDLLGIPRNAGRHASAFFISDEPISSSVPTFNVSGVRCTQYTAAWAEKAGLIKFDLLRVNTLSFISDCLRLVQKRLGFKVWEETVRHNGQDFVVTKGELPLETLPMRDGRLLDVYTLPEEEGVFAQFDAGDTETIFQMSTPLLTGFGKRLKPRKIDDLSAAIALVRPGPLNAVIEKVGDEDLTMTEAYIRRRNGEMPVTYVHEGLKPILEDTYGVFVYQEQEQSLFADLAGYTPEEADHIRELIAKKKRQDMESALPEIRSRLASRGWSEAQIEVVISLLIASASYVFNCIDEDQLLRTRAGLKSIKEVVANGLVDEVATFDGHGIVFEKPSIGQRTGHKEVLEVELEDGSVIRATEDHRFLSNGTYMALKDIIAQGGSIDCSCECGSRVTANMKTLKIKSVKRLGARDVYDIEMPTNHNFVLDNGAIAHNCSHSASYAVVAYICAYLKHHYPLEWWTSVLKNCKIDDIKEKGYGRAVRDLLVMPHINGPTRSFELRDDGKIHAPFYLVDGVGDAVCSVISSEREARGDFLSFQDFFERTKSDIDARVVHNLILSGAFSLIETRSVKELVVWYHLLRRVSSLKTFGFGKKGSDLASAALKYLESGKQLQVPELFVDEVDLEAQRVAILPIYKMDVHSRFSSLFRNSGVLYDDSGVATAFDSSSGKNVRVIKTAQEGSEFIGKIVGWIGYVTDVSEFQYQDKRQKTRVTACKLQVVNDGESIECVLWPDQYAKLKVRPNRLVFAKGIIRESREPGKFSLSVSGIKQF